MEHIWTESGNIDVQRIVNIARVLSKGLVYMLHKQSNAWKKF